MTSSEPKGTAPAAKRFVAGLVLLRAGAVPPPIAAERETSRVVDGFHRVEAHRRVHGRAGSTIPKRPYDH